MPKFSRKQLKGIGYVALFSLAILIWYSRSQTPDTQIIHKYLYEGISKNLRAVSSSDDLKITLLIPGEEVELNTWSFRGNINKQSSDQPFYGTIRKTCEKIETHACWKIQKLNIDGHVYQLEDANLPGRLKDQENTSLSFPQASLPTHASSITMDLPTLSQANTHTLNARYLPIQKTLEVHSGPGQRYNKIRTVQDNNVLVLTGKKRNWGQFYNLNHPDDLFWIKFDHLRKIN
ncbi:hypothetical protein [Terasakiella pusilla]|uniref:hypothetical protein n=1 Tax=Terasakiella pusilla TaxID=64973 RepID=UPI003AA7B821